MSSIRNTITETLRSNGLSSYARSAEPVIAALEEREQGALDVIQQKGVALGATVEQIESILIEAGLVEPTPEPEVTNAEPQTLEAMIASLTETVQGLVQRLDSASQQASRHGIRF